MKVDILAIGVHPDDIELGCSGTIFRHLEAGYSVALCDLTSGELGSRGSGELRLKEAEKARILFGIQSRENIMLADGFFQKNQESLLKLIEVIRAYQPDIVLANALADRHPDHGRAADFIKDACFLAGLVKIETSRNEKVQTVWRPKSVYHYIQDYYRHPDFVVDISSFMKEKLEVIMAYSSQFYNPDTEDVETPISGKSFLHIIEARARQYGRLIGVEFAEGFNTNRALGLKDLVGVQ